MRPRKFNASERHEPDRGASAQIIPLNAAAVPGADKARALTTGPRVQGGSVTLKQRLMALAEGNAPVRQSVARRRASANDLQKVLDSAGLAIVLLDLNLRIRLFTPATRMMFNILASDIGRPLSDLNCLAPDVALSADARDLLCTLDPVEREIATPTGKWYVRRILPFRTDANSVDGVVVTFVDVTRQKEASAALERARLQAVAASATRSRFLATASHDLRQPLQTLVLVQELLAKAVGDGKAVKLVARLGETLDGMAVMMNALFDVNPIEGGGASAECETLRTAWPRTRVTSEPDGQADAQRIAPEVPPRKLPVDCDPRLQEPMPVVCVVDDDPAIRQVIRSMLEDDGRLVEDFPDGEAFLAAFRPGRKACLLIDAQLPGISGVALLKHLKDAGQLMPAIMVTGHSDVPMAVEAMKAGALDFLEKPIRGVELLAGVARGLEQADDAGKLTAWRKNAADHLAGLTRRQTEVMELVLAGQPSKNIAADLGISQRTVENHRAAIMKRTGSRSMPALARLALAAAWRADGPA